MLIWKKHFKFTSMSWCISVTYISLMQNPHPTPEHLIGISVWLLQTDQWLLMLTFIRLCQSLCIDIDTWMQQPHSSRGKLSINIENNVIGFQDCSLCAHHYSVPCATHAEFKMSSPQFWLGAKWQARILYGPVAILFLFLFFFSFLCLFVCFCKTQLKACHDKGTEEREGERASL